MVVFNEILLYVNVVFEIELVICLCLVENMMWMIFLDFVIDFYIEGDKEVMF